MKINFLFVVAVALFFASCQPKNADVPKKIIGQQELKLTNDLLTPELLWAFGRVSDPKVSPDQSTILFGVTWYDVQENKGNRELYTMKADGSAKTKITNTAFSEYDAQWTSDGKIVFMSAEKDGMQVWKMDADGGNRIQLTQIEGGINGYAFSPDMKRLLYVAEVPAEKVNKELFEGLDKTSGKLMNDLNYRHWDSWVESYSHIFLADFDGKALANNMDIMKGEEWESPLRPFGGMEQITWSPDGKSIVYTCRKKKGKDYALSTNSDIYQFVLETGKTTNLSEGMMGYDVAPSFSPDGKLLAWQSMERDGYEADQNRLILMDVATGATTIATAGFDQDVNGFVWAADGKTIWFTSNDKGTDEIYSFTLESKTIKQITKGIHDIKQAIPMGDKLLAVQVSMSKPDELYMVNPVDGQETELSFINKALLDQLSFGKVTQRWIKTTNGEMMHTWVILPAHFDSTKVYPTLLFCEGGPQSTVSQFWSYRWNMQIMAANGYVIVAPNRHGVPGFGQKWKEQISGDYGGQNMQDYMVAIDEVAKEPWADETKMGCVGASYGGFSVYWLAGHHNKRFKAFIAHDGMFNLESQYLETEEMWFVNFDLGGPFWDKSNAVAQRSFANSPHRFVDKWDSPILVIHGELDYRITASQGMSAFNAAILRGIPAEYLYFPDENHWVLKPQNSILWQRVYFNWLQKWLK